MDLGLVLTIVGTVLAIIAFPATYYMGRRNRQKPDLCYVMDFDVLMSPDDGLAGGNVGLTIGGRAIERISRTYIALFNSKGDSVSGGDVVTSDKLRVSVEEGDTILQARVIAVSRPQCGFNLAALSSDGRAMEVNFDFMDAQDGAILEVLHEGDSSAAITGTIRGATFRDRGKGDLTPSAIRTIAAKSLVARFNHYSNKKGQNRFTFSVTLLMPLVLLGTVAYQAWSLFLNIPSGPVSVEGIDFNSLEGQEKFLTIAAAAGLRPDTFKDQLPGLIASIVMGCALAFYTYRMLVVDRIPTTITSHVVERDLSK